MPRRPLRVACCIALVAALMSLQPQPAVAVVPTDEAVEQAKQKAVKFLSQNMNEGGITGQEVGVHCLVAVALLKCDQPKSHPVVQKALNSFRQAVQTGEINQGYEAVYTLGIGMVLAAALGEKALCQNALKQLLTHQREHGGFAARAGGADGGDTSMTQYAVLGMWEAAQIGVYAPPNVWQGVAKWLMDTQLEDGRFLYNPGGGRTAIGDTGHSMAAGGVGTLYIIANYARPRGGTGKTKTTPEGKREREPAEVPSVLTPVGGQKKDSNKEKVERVPLPGGVSIDMGRWETAVGRTNTWLSRNFNIAPQSWTFYYLYALERYYAFKEMWEGRNDPEPEWYDQASNYLLKQQQVNGAWPAIQVSERVNTSFAVLVLIRGTRKGLKTEDKAGGTLLSGSGLPTDLSNVRLKDGRIAVKPLAGPAGDMLEIMEKPDDPRFLEAVEGLKELVVKADDIMLSPHLVRLNKMAKNPSPEARAAAITLLGKSRDLDYVPTLIFALRDQDDRVVAAAWEALRFVSRRFDSFGMSPDFKGEDEKARAQAREKAIERWKEWYRTVRPDAEFED